MAKAERHVLGLQGERLTTENTVVGLRRERLKERSI